MKLLLTFLEIILILTQNEAILKANLTYFELKNEIKIVSIWIQPIIPRRKMD